MFRNFKSSSRTLNGCTWRRRKACDYLKVAAFGSLIKRGWFETCPYIKSQSFKFTGYFDFLLFSELYISLACFTVAFSWMMARNPLIMATGCSFCQIFLPRFTPIAPFCIPS